MTEPDTDELSTQPEERSRLTLAALSDVDCGQVISHQAVQVWADSLVSDNPLPLPHC